MTRIDIIMLTKDSMEPCLPECLHALEENVLASKIDPRLIVIDKASTNGTQETILNYTTLNPVIIPDPEGNRATARQKGIEAVATEFFVFLDSDVILEPNWFTIMLDRYFTNPHVGAVWGVTKAQEATEVAYKKALQKVYRQTSVEMSLKYAAKRGLTHDTMIRTEAIKGIQIPPELHVCEDHYIRLHIESQGYFWINSEHVSCIHNRHDRIGKEAYLDAYYGYKLGIHTRKWLLKHLFLWPAKLTYLAIMTRNRKLIKIEAVKEWNFLKAIGRIVKEWFTN